MAADFRARLDALIGQPVGSGDPAVAPDPVNMPMIRHWAAAFEDANPVYTDPDFAATTRFGGIVSPPLMLQTWTMATVQITGIRERGGSPVPTSGTSLLAVLDEAGFVATLASDSEFEIERYLHPGDMVSSTTVIETISDEKRTRVGLGHFVTWVTTYVDGDGEVVGRQRFRILKFKPRIMTRRTVDWSAIAVGDELSPLAVDVTATVIVAGAIATRDFMPVHHDKAYANAQGAPDIFMNILSDTAYASRFLTDWAGPEVMVRRLAVRLGAPMFPGSMLTYTGEVTATSPPAGGSDGGTVEVAFRAVNDLGVHVSGTATLEFPGSTAASTLG